MTRQDPASASYEDWWFGGDRRHAGGHGPLHVDLDTDLIEVTPRKRQISALPLLRQNELSDPHEQKKRLPRRRDGDQPELRHRRHRHITRNFHVPYPGANSNRCGQADPADQCLYLRQKLEVPAVLLGRVAASKSQTLSLSRHWFICPIPITMSCSTDRSGERLDGGSDQSQFYWKDQIRDFLIPGRTASSFWLGRSRNLPINLHTLSPPSRWKSRGSFPSYSCSESSS